MGWRRHGLLCEVVLLTMEWLEPLIVVVLYLVWLVHVGIYMQLAGAHRPLLLGFAASLSFLLTGLQIKHRWLIQIQNVIYMVSLYGAVFSTVQAFDLVSVLAFKDHLYPPDLLYFPRQATCWPDEVNVGNNPLCISIAFL